MFGLCARGGLVSKGLDEIRDSQYKLSNWFERFAEQTAGSEMYQYLSLKVAKDRELLELAATAEQSQPVPNLFFAAINFLLYKNPQDKLARFYPIHSGKAFSAEGLFEQFKSFCFHYAQQLTSIMTTRLVQTNEVRRCALLLPAIAKVQKAVSSEIALIDVGASSGLNLLLDRYFYSYSDGTQLGNPDSPLKISCEIRGANLELEAIPKIARRIGIDLNPIDLSDPEEVLWTMSLVWPDQVERVERLKSAIQILKSNPVELHRGDAVTLLPRLVENLSSSLQVCVMHSFTLNQFSIEARNKFEQALCELARDRGLWRISLEWLGTETPVIILDHYASGKLKSKKTLARCHGHGDWLDIAAD